MKRMFAFAVCLVAVVAVGCGSSSKSSSSSNTSTTSAATPPATTPAPATTTGGGGGSGKATNLALSADPGGQLKFDKASLTAKAGAVTIVMSNPSSVPHGIAINGNGVSKTGAIVNQGGKSTITATLKPGTYQYLCPVPGHAQAGMVGTLKVQ